MAQYRANILATETVSWIGKTGKQITITITLKQMEQDYFGHGDWKADGAPSITERSTVDGITDDFGYYQPITHPEAVAKVGTVGLNASRNAEVMAAIAKVKAHPAYVAYETRYQEGLRAEEEYGAHTAAVNRLMTGSRKRRTY